jgi:hypothetical protein
VKALADARQSLPLIFRRPMANSPPLVFTLPSADQSTAPARARNTKVSRKSAIAGTKRVAHRPRSMLPPGLRVHYSIFNLAGNRDRSVRYYCGGPIRGSFHWSCAGAARRRVAPAAVGLDGHDLDAEGHEGPVGLRPQRAHREVRVPRRSRSGHASFSHRPVDDPCVSRWGRAILPVAFFPARSLVGAR